MLDFYMTSDLCEPINVKKDDYLGSLSLDEHRFLQPLFKHPQGIDINPFEDTYIDSEQVTSLLHLCQNSMALIKNEPHVFKAFEKMLDILQCAAQKTTGVIAVCD